MRNPKRAGRYLRGFIVPLVLLLLAGCTGADVPALLTRATSTPTPTASPTATATPTPTPTATPTPTPTPLPEVIMSEADTAVFIGDWPAAITAYQTLITHPGAAPEEIDAAEIGLAKVYLAQETYDEALALLSDRVMPYAPDATVPEDPTVITPTVDLEATVLFADALQATGSHITASHYYSVALSHRPELGLYINEWRGDALLAAGAPLTATQAYSRALTAAETASERVWLLEKIATAATTAGDYDGVLAAYDDILDVARIAAYRAAILYRAAYAALTFGETDEAYQRMEALATEYPTTDVAYESMIHLVEAGYPVDEMLRGMVDYYAAAYAPAVRAFARVVSTDPEHTGAPHYYAALSLLADGSPQLALNEFELLIETHPDDPLTPAAWIGKGRALMQLGEEALALESFATAAEVTTEPPTAEARDALWMAARDFEQRAELELAADFFLTFADRHPEDERAPQGRFQAGLLRYRLGDIEAAQEAWRSLTVWYPYGAQAQSAWYWLGKTQLAAGETISATAALSQAVSLGPWDFYGIQAADMLEGRAPFPADAVIAAPCDTREAQDEAEAWLASWLELDAEIDVGAMSADLMGDPRLHRAMLLLRMGHTEEARLELEKLRVAMSHDALAQYHLALAFRDLGVYRSSISAATALWQLSPAQDLTTLPRFIGCLVYPTYYSELVEPAAASADLPPLLVYALLRQESLFEGNATSHAAAHGLMQVIPPTGAAIAQTLDWPPDYETRDLYRPMVSVRFGTWYLAEQRDLIDGDLFAAMAAYNGGPGNSLRWWDMADSDPDLFVELIGFSETFRYVRLIREQFEAYYWLYNEAVKSTEP